MDLEALKIDILKTALADIPFDGWTLNAFKAAAVKLEHDEVMIDALFPQGIHDTLKTFSYWIDQDTSRILNDIDTTDMRVRDRVSLGVQKRIETLSPYKDSIRESAKILATPNYLRLGAQMTWDSSDMIWNWAGDTATDYNRYTKRGLLSGVIGSTMLYWLQDDSENFEKTTHFLNRRIDNVLFIGKNIAPLIKPVASLFERFIVPKKSGEK
ncbi:MAG: COQ9 family protein [Alphaproteobacteria bacterium]|nr:MAG: COQ9 family protein [Alphaproteobacteria bacterium]